MRCLDFVLYSLQSLLFILKGQCATVQYRKNATSGPNLKTTETMNLSSDMDITIGDVQSVFVKSGCFISGYFGTNFTEENFTVSFQSFLF